MLNGTMVFREAVIESKLDPCMELLIVDEDNCVINSALIIPEEHAGGSLFVIYRSNGRSSINTFNDPRNRPVILGKSPASNIDSQKNFMVKLGANRKMWKNYIKGLFTLALLDYCFMLKELCKIQVLSPDVTARDKNEIIEDFLDKSLNYF